MGIFFKKRTLRELEVRVGAGGRLTLSNSLVRRKSETSFKKTETALQELASTRFSLQQMIISMYGQYVLESF